MKLSWLFVILLLIFVAVFSVQNAGVIMVQFLTWEMQISAALVILLAALLGGLVGLGFGAWSGRTPRPIEKLPQAASAPASPATSSAPAAPARPALNAGSTSTPPAKPVGSGAATPAAGTPIVVPPARDEKR